MVLLNHAVPLVPSRLAWVSFVFDGNLGVRIFFVLSGFLISSLLLREATLHGAINLRHFYGRRALRIFPVYFAFLAVLAVLSLFGLYHESMSTWVGALTFTRNVVGRMPSATAHLWSLAIEEQFYLVWPLAIAGLGLWRRGRLYVGILLALLISSPIFRHHVSLNFGTILASRILGPRSPLMYADSLATGCLLAWLLQKKAKWPFGINPNAVLLGLAAVIGVDQWIRLANVTRFGELMPLVEALVIGGCIWVSLDERCVVYRVLNSRVLTTVGVGSYSLYIWHVLFLGPFMGQELAGLLGYEWRFWPLAAAVVAYFSYVGLERPVMNWRNRLRHDTRRVSETRPAVVALTVGPHP